ncbi:MAG: class B sortase [Oscillospiraceae bacterium]|nr:class B sortase [Oscillospiraceae bacterium]
MKNVLKVMAAAILTAAFAFLGVQLWLYFTSEQQTAEQFNDLTILIQPQPSEPEMPESMELASPEWAVFDQYGTLFEQNADMIGWIFIDGTTINYPVMQTLDRPNFYLKQGFDKTSSDYGVPYATEACSIVPQSDNITIYGHHMKGGAMFGALDSYKREDFYREHPVIGFDTHAGFGKHEILAVIKVNLADFLYHEFINAADEVAFAEYVNRCKELSFYETGVTAASGDKLITLSTCEYTRQGNQLVVVAKKIGGELSG